MSEAKPYDISKRLVWDAWEQVKENHGAAGMDGVSIAAFEKELKRNLFKVWNRMSSGSYFAPPVRLVEIPKANGGIRPLGIPTIADRVAQTVVKMVLEPEVEPIFHPASYGYRPGRSALDAVGAARERCWKFDWVIDLDIKSFFDTIPHDLIEKAVARHTELGWVRLYVKRWLKAPVERADGTHMERARKEPRKVPSSRPCWRICSCTMHSTYGCKGRSLICVSRDMRMMQLSTAGARAKLGLSWRRSGNALPIAVWSFILRRPGSSTARMPLAGNVMKTWRSISWATHSNHDGRETGRARTSSASCRRSAPRRPKESGRPSAHGG